MKKFIHKIQDLSQKAAQLKQVVEAAPGQAAQLRDTVLMTAGQLQQLRLDVQSSVTGLRADSDDRLAQALREIHDNATVFEEAGYELVGVDMELSPIQRLVVHFQKFTTIPEPVLRTLVSSHSAQPTTYALLAALAKADAVSQKVRVSHLTYREVVIHVGPTPSVRLCWRMEDDDQATAQPVAAAPTPVGSVPSASPVTTPPPPLPAFASSSFFEQRSAGATSRPSAASTSPPPTPPAPALPAAPSAAASNSSTDAHVSTTGSPYVHQDTAAGSDWKKSALDRFKKMPDGSKYRR